MQARPVAGDEPADPLLYAMQLHVLMSQAEMELWESLADRRRLDVDDVVHAEALTGLKYQLKQAGDEIGMHAAAQAAAPHHGQEQRRRPHGGDV